MTPNGQSNKTDSKLNPGLNFTPHGQCNTIPIQPLHLSKKAKTCTRTQGINPQIPCSDKAQSEMHHVFCRGEREGMQ